MRTGSAGAACRRDLSIGDTWRNLERSFRRINGCSDMKTLTKAIPAEIARRREQPGDTAAVPAA